MPRDLYSVGGAWLRFLPAGMSLMLFHCEAIGWATAEWPQGRGDLPVGSFVQQNSKRLSNIWVLLIPSEYCRQLREIRRCLETGSAPNPGVVLTLLLAILFGFVGAFFPAPCSVLSPLPSHRWIFTSLGEPRASWRPAVDGGSVSTQRGQGAAQTPRLHVLGSGQEKGRPARAPECWASQPP